MVENLEIAQGSDSCGVTVPDTEADAPASDTSECSH